MEANTLIQERQQLRELVAQYSDDAKTLPYLRAEPDESWIQKMWAAGQEWASEWLEWLRDTTGPLPTFGMWHIDWTLIAQIVFWGCAGLLVCSLVWWLVKKGLTLNLTPHDRKTLLTQPLTEEGWLSQQLRTAIDEEDWGLAARLRWRLFLYRIEAQPHLTPNELFAQADYRQRWERHQGVSIREQYRVMFADAQGSQWWYDQYHVGLAGLEGPLQNG